MLSEKMKNQVIALQLGVLITSNLWIIAIGLKSYDLKWPVILLVISIVVMKHLKGKKQ